MAKLSSINNRLVFKKGNQNKLLVEFMVSESFKQQGASDFFGIVPRSFTDWLREKTKLPQSAYNKIPKQIRNKYLPSKTVDQYWYAKKGSKIGYKRVIEKYGELPKNESRRKLAWKKWWDNTGKDNNRVIGITKHFKRPEFSNELAEFVGILLGDGGIQKYQIKISLNLKKDARYAKYITKLIKNLFDVKTGSLIIKKGNVRHIYISRKEITLFLESIGLERGNKTIHQVKIPEWIRSNNDYSRHCIRGLFDTDGCIVIEKHKNLEKYSYPRLNFTNHSKNLINAVFEILSKLNLNPKIRRGGKAVQVENFDKICDYFQIVGSSNPRILNRWLEAVGRDV